LSTGAVILSLVVLKQETTMDQNLAVWLTRIGILFELLSFWFAAPELLGEKRLRAIEMRLEKPLWHWRRLSLMKRTDLLFLLGGLTVFTFGMFLGKLPWPLPIVIPGLLGLLVIIVGTIAEIVMTTLATYLLHQMINDENIRQRSLLAGAVLFVLGTILQFLGTF
jgi:hypothetical protein